jgi:hypothetical protein
MAAKMTVKQALVKSRDAYKQEKTRSVPTVVARVVGPFRVGDSAQHGIYARAVEAVFHAACPRKKNENYNAWIGRLPSYKARKAWAQAFDKAISDTKEDQ